MKKIKLIIAIAVFFIFCLPNTLNAQDPEEYSYKLCEESQGKATFDLNEVATTILNENNFFGVEPTILIGTFSGQIFQYFDLGTDNVQKLYICPYSDYLLYDIAVDENGNIYVGTFEGIYIVDPDNFCYYRLVYSGATRGLSFDKRGYLYFAEGGPVVYRTSNGLFTNIEVWHEFEEGFPSGDFTEFEGKLYIAWGINDVDYLYEVTIDPFSNYVSHVNLGILPRETYGLASELGVLYGVTPGKLFEINPRDFSFTDVLINEKEELDEFWFGVAGFHEAVDIVYTFHETLLDAENGIEINEDLLFTESRTIYIKYRNKNTGNRIIIAVNLEVILQLTQIEDLESCDNYELPPIENASYFIEDNESRVKIPPGTIIKSSTEIFIVDEFCGDEISFNVDIVKFPNFFTPNDDGENDEWKLNCDNLVNENVTIKIFDRFGKILFYTENQELGWDGTYNNIKLPSGDYWYSLIFENGENTSGHFALRR